MCGRFSLSVSPEKLQASFPHFQIPRDLPPSYNIAPSQPIPVIPNDGKETLDFYRWGLIPSWADEKFLKYNLINARGETAAEKPSFRSSFRHHRCLILADGFYEWQETDQGQGKTPYFIRMKDQRPFAFAGLWDLWHSPHGDPIRSAAILTTQPNSLVEPIHDRMPVILPDEAYQKWLSPEEQKVEISQGWIKPFPGKEMEAFPVSSFVNNPRNNSPQCIQPLKL